MNNTAITPDSQHSELQKFKIFYEQIDDTTPTRRRSKQKQAK